MAKPWKTGGYGRPRKLPANHLTGAAQPTGVADPRLLGGAIAGPGGPHDRGGVVVDPTDSVLLAHTDVAVVDAVRAGVLAEPVIFMVLGGRVNKRTDEVSVGFMFGPDGAAAIITELLAVADRFGAELLGDVTRRLTELHQNKHVDLRFLRAAIDNVLDQEAE